jgi:hypothetical protein
MKKTGWVHPNDAGYYVGTMLGEPRHIARKNGKTYIRGWVDQKLVEAIDWPYSPEGNERACARVNAEQVCTQVAELLASEHGQLAPDWDMLEVDLKTRMDELGRPDLNHEDPNWRHVTDAIRWCARWLSDRGQTVPGDRTIRR